MVGHPFDTIKVRQQTMNSALWPAIKQTFIHEGIRGFYKGMLFPLLSMGPSNAVLFGVYGNSLRILQGNTKVERIDISKENVIKDVFIAGLKKFHIKIAF